MKVTMLLADAAQVEAGKLYILGGGWSTARVPCPPLALAVKVEAEFDLEQLDWALTLLDEDARPITLPGAAAPLVISASIPLQFDPTRPAGVDQDVPLVVNMGPLPLPPGRYTWQLSLNDEVDPTWTASFTLV